MRSITSKGTDVLKHDQITEGIQETAALYALGALSQHEARSFENHLREGCPICGDELRRFEDVVSGLGTGAEEVQPPDYLRDLLAARIEREGQSETVPVDEEAHVPPSTPPPPISTPAEPRWGIFPWAAAASLALVAVLSIYFWRIAEQNHDVAMQELAGARDEIQQLESILAEQRRPIEELDSIHNALSTPGTRVVLLSGQPVAAESNLAIIWNTEQNRWVLTGKLPPLPPGRVYQLWFVTTRARVSAGILQTDDRGQSHVVVEVPPDLRQIDAAAITLEPEGGSAQPTMPIYALGTIG